MQKTKRSIWGIAGFRTIPMVGEDRHANSNSKKYTKKRPRRRDAKLDRAKAYGESAEQRPTQHNQQKKNAIENKLPNWRNFFSNGCAIVSRFSNDLDHFMSFELRGQWFWLFRALTLPQAYVSSFGNNSRSKLIFVRFFVPGSCCDQLCSLEL